MFTIKRAFKKKKKHMYFTYDGDVTVTIYLMK